MPRAPETPWSTPTITPAPRERLPEADRPLVCNCDPYPCVEQSCQRDSLSAPCAACKKHGQALFTRAEIRWIETGEGLRADVVLALENLWGTHDGHNSRLLRETGVKYGTGAKLPEPVAEAC